VRLRLSLEFIQFTTVGILVYAHIRRNIKGVGKLIKAVGLRPRNSKSDLQTESKFLPLWPPLSEDDEEMCRKADNSETGMRRPAV